MNRTSSKIGAKTAAALVVANMIGTGVFTSLGFQVVDIRNTWSILLLWIIGGVVALTGAFSYAELGSLYKRSGGEYEFLSRAYHPLVGYLAGWISLTVGFAAPVGLAAMAMGSYLEVFSGGGGKLLALGVVVGISLVHSLDLRQSSTFQNAITLLKVLLIAAIIGAGLAVAPSEDLLDLSSGWVDEITLPAFAVALVFVTYSYTGWNAAAYIVDEIMDVSNNLPKALVRGTLLVTVLYVLLHFVFLKHTPIPVLSGKVEIGQLFAEQVFGGLAGKVISGLIAFFLLSGISAMVWVGPRVSMVMGEDHSIWRFLKKKNRHGIPVTAIWFQAFISMVMILTGTFEQVLVYCGFILQISAALTVCASFRVRKKGAVLPYRSPFHPVFPIVFIAISIWILAYLIKTNPWESVFGLINILIGYVTWLANKRTQT